MVLNLGFSCAIRRMALPSLFIALAGIGAQAQNWGPSVTSMGFGGSNRTGGIPPSVTSLGFGQTGRQEWNHREIFTQGSAPRPDFDSHHHHPYNSGWGSYYAYPIYIESQDAYQNAPQVADNPDDYRGGPTIFDRRGDGLYPQRRSDSAPQPVEQQPATVSQPVVEVASQPQTVLIFKDGHTANVDNYAIVGSTLYDLTGGMRHKIALADLNLTATAQQNDDRGVDFELPAGSTSN